MCGLLLVSGCTKNFDELNRNPNGVTDVDPDFLFTQAVARTVDDYSIGTHTEIWGLMVWMQHMADSAGIGNAGNEYAYGNDWNEEVWKRWYADAIMPLQLVIEATEDDPYLINKNAQARIWRVYAFHRLTDLYGDIPYTAALTATSNKPDFSPAYDTQKTVYTDLLNELKAAVASMDDAQGTFGAADPIYAGDNEAWTRFANSLRLRLAIRISGVDPTLATTHASEVLQSNLLISEEAQSARFRFQDGTERAFFTLSESGQGMRSPSKFFLDLLRNSNDPRLPVFAEPTPFSNVIGIPGYAGIPNLLTKAELNQLNLSAFNTSAVGNYFLDIDLPGTTLSYAEVALLQAEAALNGWPTTATADWYYNESVRAHMQSLGVADSAITAYLAGPGMFNNSLEQVITQKWIVFAYTDGFEAFAEYRRTGFPILTDVAGNPVDATQIPKRLPYPQSEVSLNGENVTAVGSGINDTDTRLWWDVN